jgi:hypothetical protein
VSALRGWLPNLSARKIQGPAWLAEVDWPIVRRSTMRKRTRSAFELGYDAGEARLRERMYS